MFKIQKMVKEVNTKIDQPFAVSFQYYMFLNYM